MRGSVTASWTIFLRALVSCSSGFTGRRLFMLTYSSPPDVHIASVSVDFCTFSTFSAWRWLSALGADSVLLSLSRVREKCAMLLDVYKFSVSLVAFGRIPLVFYVKAVLVLLGMCSASFAGHDAPCAVFTSVVGNAFGTYFTQFLREGGDTDPEIDVEI